MSPTTRLVAAQILLLVGLVSCGGAADEAAEGEGVTPSTTTTASDEGGTEADDGSGVVEISDFRFEPAEATVAVGTTVRWENHDDATHSVVDRALDAESGALARGDTFERTYDEAGTFPYLCGIHNFMEGTITVEERPAPPG